MWEMLKGKFYSVNPVSESEKQRRVVPCSISLTETWLAKKNVLVRGVACLRVGKETCKYLF